MNCFPVILTYKITRDTRSTNQIWLTREESLLARKYGEYTHGGPRLTEEQFPTTQSYCLSKSRAACTSWVLFANKPHWQQLIKKPSSWTRWFARIDTRLMPSVSRGWLIHPSLTRYIQTFPPYSTEWDSRLAVLLKHKCGKGIRKHNYFNRIRSILRQPRITIRIYADFVDSTTRRRTVWMAW